MRVLVGMDKPSRDNIIQSTCKQRTMDLFFYFVDSSFSAFLEYFILNIRDKCCTFLNGLKSLYFNVSFLLSVYLALLCG